MQPKVTTKLKAPRPNRTKYPFAEMVAGSSFPLKGLDENKVRSAAYQWAIRNDNTARFSVQTLQGKKHLFRMV